MMTIPTPNEKKNRRAVGEIFQRGIPCPGPTLVFYVKQRSLKLGPGGALSCVTYTAGLLHLPPPALPPQIAEEQKPSSYPTYWIYERENK